jgi:NtrC-family two-component system sensor histidine kinase KinB
MTDSENETGSGVVNDLEVVLRKAWLEFGERDEAIIKEEIDGIVSEHVDEMMDSMYAHFLAFEETRGFFPDDETLSRAKSAQKAYFLRLTQGDYDEDYVRDRLRIGSTHHRIELDPKWYIGAYNRILALIIPMLVKRLSGDNKRLSETLLSLQKIVYFDMGLAIESYIGAKELAIRKHRDVIHELQTEQRVIKGILEGAPIGIVTLSQDFVCLQCSEELVSILELASRKDAVGKSLFELAPALNREFFQEILRNGQPCRQSADRLNLSKSGTGENSYWDWAAWPVKDDSGKITGLVAMFANASDRVLLQQQREDFVATLTHDLKTPVLATNRAIKYLLEGDFGVVPDSQKEILETVLQSNSALYSLVQTLLDVYRFDSGVKDLHMKSCNLAAIITQMVAEIMPLAHHKGVELKALLPGNAKDISCDKDEIRRVIQNLVDNSLKFTPTGGSITVTMEQAGETTSISVADTGKGIPEENKPKLFQRFWQAGSTGRYYASTGLGLYLCRRIVEAHGGKIWCESSVGHGSTFYIEL